MRGKEEARSNLAKEAETQRNNIATLNETNRHNLAMEELQKQANALNYQISAERNQTSLSQALIGERSASKVAGISASASRDVAMYYVNENARHNKIVEEENTRHNKQVEAINKFDAETRDYSSQTDRLRYNLEYEINPYRKQYEMYRAVNEGKRDTFYEWNVALDTANTVFSGTRAFSPILGGK